MKKNTILLVEDDPYLSEIYARHFSRHKWQTKIVKNFSEADKKIKRSLPEMVVADIFLEEKAGLKWLKDFRQTEATRKIPVIIMTGLSDRASIKEALLAGVNGYFLKSQTTPHELAEKINGLIATINPSSIPLTPS